MFNLTKPSVVEVERQRFTVTQAADHLGITRDYVYKLIRQGRIIPHKYLGRTCIYVEDCVIKRRDEVNKPFKRRAVYNIRTKEQIKKDKEKLYKKKYEKRKRKKYLDSLSPEERDKVLRIERNRKARTRKKKKIAREKKNKRCSITEEQQE